VRAEVSADSADEARLAHARPAALAVDSRGDLLYVALSTEDRLMAVDVTRAQPAVAWELPICRYPTALAALPGGGVVVSCRFEPDLRVVTRSSGTRPLVRAVNAGPEHGHRGVAVDSAGRYAYVASAALGGVKVVALPPASSGSLAESPRALGSADSTVRFRATGLGPSTVRWVAPEKEAMGGPQPSPLLVVANRIGHTVTIHRIAGDGGLSAPIQTIVTEAPVLDLQVTADALWLLTYEDRPITRVHRDVEGLDSVMLRLPRGPPGSLPFEDAGSGKRETTNLTERAGAPLVALESSATFIDRAGAPVLAIAGAGTDNVWVGSDLRGGAAQSAARVLPVGSNPAAVAFLTDGRVVTADRLSDTLTFVPPGGGAAAPEAGVEQLAIGRLQRSTAAELGELLFFSRSLVPNNVADGPLSIYTCAACHVDGHIDGRRHPSKFNRFFSMTKTCRGLAGTAPFLSLGDPATLAGFADNIVSTHAQGASAAPDTFDRYDVKLRLPGRDSRGGVTWSELRLSAEALRADLAAYMSTIPVEPSPFVSPGRARLTPQERSGLRHFRASCAGCHRLASTTKDAAPIAAARLEGELLAGHVALTAAGRFDVGTPVLGKGGNNPPSLHAVWAAAPYFSDGSAATLEDVLARTDPQAEKVHAASNALARPPAFSRRAVDELLAFLRAL
jgi:hypothetical protein